MTLIVDVAGILKTAGRPATRVLLDSPVPVDRVRDLVHAVHDSADGYGRSVELAGAPVVRLVEDARVTPTGLVLGIDPTTYRGFEQTLRNWAAALDHAGLDGTVRPYRAEKPPFLATVAPTPTPNVIAAIAFGGDDDGVGGARRVPAPVVEDFLTTAFTWADAGGSAVHVCHDLVSSRVRDSAQARAFVACAMSLDSTLPVSVHWSTPESFRTVGWDRAGHAWLQVADPRPWHEHVAELRGTVEAFAPHLVHALLRVGDADEQSWTAALNSRGQHLQPPGAGRRYVSVITHDEETRFVPDAYGAQLMGPEHQAHASDLSGWVHEPVGRMTWVRAHDMAAWFAAPPAPSLVERAREDFGAAILSTEQFMRAFVRERDRPARRHR